MDIQLAVNTLVNIVHVCGGIKRLFVYYQMPEVVSTVSA